MKIVLMTQEEEIVELKRQLLAKENQITYLMKLLRAIDDKLFSISQSSRPSTSMRLDDLIQEMMARKYAESSRINDLITEELRKTYNQQANVPRIEKHHE